jgi:hypothetical protein
MTAFASAVYLLCLFASLICAGLLIRSYARNGTRLLLWCAACFSLLALNNLLLVLDLLVLPTAADLLIVRNLASLAAVGTLLCGFIWELD